MNKEIEKLLDPNNNQDVKLYVDGKLIQFGQVANIEYLGELYTFLVPLEEMEGVEEGEGVLFQFIKVNNEIEIEFVKDDKLIDNVYQEYLNMIGDE